MYAKQLSGIHTIGGISSKVELNCTFFWLAELTSKPSSLILTPSRQVGNSPVPEPATAPIPTPVRTSAVAQKLRLRVLRMSQLRKPKLILTSQQLLWLRKPLLRRRKALRPSCNLQRDRNRSRLIRMLTLQTKMRPPARLGMLSHVMPPHAVVRIGVPC